MTDNQLFIFGDSISCGVMYDEAAHRYTLCRNTYDRVLRTQGVAVKSYAKPGCTAADAVRMLDKAGVDYSVFTENLSTGSVEYDLMGGVQ